MSHSVLALAALLAMGACAADEESVAGIVVAIDSQGLGRVEGFTLRTRDAELLDFTIAGGTEFGGGAFPPDHLREHMATVEGIAVAYRTEGEKRVVIRLSDAPWLDR